MNNYVHGYSTNEQKRLLKQATYWKSFLSKKLTFDQNEKVLEIGCGVGAVMNIVATTSQPASLFGIDIHTNQLNFAKRFFEHALGKNKFVAADARNLPFSSGSIDSVYTVWLMEHIPEYKGVITEAYRILRDGGKIVIIETDYSTFRLYPSTPDYEYLRRALIEYFSAFGNADPNTYLPDSLSDAGFRIIENGYEGFVFFNDCNQSIKKHIYNVLEFLGPLIPLFSDRLGFDYTKLYSGILHMRSIIDNSDATFIEGIYCIEASK